MSISLLDKRVINCKKCDRLVHFREKIARDKRKSFYDWKYWGKPVPGYGSRTSKYKLLKISD